MKQFIIAAFIVLTLFFSLLISTLSFIDRFTSMHFTGQGGLSHVNNKALVDVIAQMNRRGFEYNKEAGEPLRRSSSFSWLKGNVNVYYRKDPKSFVVEDA